MGTTSVSSVLRRSLGGVLQIDGAMRGRVFTVVAALLAVLLLGVHAIYEDQVGEVDWLRRWASSPARTVGACYGVGVDPVPIVFEHF